jgi:hypothetical protein
MNGDAVQNALAELQHAADSIANARRIIQADLPAPPSSPPVVVTPPTPPAAPSVLPFGLTAVKTIRGVIPTTGNARWFSAAVGGFGVNDLLVFAFQAPPAGDRYFNLSMNAVLHQTFRMFSLALAQGDFVAPIWQYADMGFSINLSSGPSVLVPAQFQLTPGVTYFLNVCNRWQGQPSVADKSDVFIECSNPQE